MIPQELIRKKRDGGTLTDEELAFIVEGIATGGLSDGQIAAFAMAVFFRDLSDPERVALTGAMTRSGIVLQWDDGPVLDKHSTGGVGDKVSLLLAPILAACGGKVPMISGRGLGHTGGTLDKLDSIPGYKTAPDLALLRATVAEAGCAIIGQTPDLAPADRRFYALRDATATVESIPLIVASILSKKLAAGLDALVMDVKAGSGAFLPERERSAELARAIVAVARGNGLACEALLTDMDQVLGRTAGNAVEVREARRRARPPARRGAAAARGHARALRHPAAARRRPRDRRGGARRRRRGARQRRGRRALRRDEPRSRRPGGHRRRPGPPPAARAARAGGLPGGGRPRAHDRRARGRRRRARARRRPPARGPGDRPRRRPGRRRRPRGGGRPGRPPARRDPRGRHAAPPSGPPSGSGPPSPSATRPPRCRR